jgi:hypothetical protein
MTGLHNRTSAYPIFNMSGAERAVAVVAVALLIVLMAAPGVALATPAIAKKIVPVSMSGGMAVPGLDLNLLAAKIRETEALGAFAKLRLKGEVDALVTDFVQLHRGDGDQRRDTLRARFEGLVRETVAALSAGDPKLATLVARSRPALWQALNDAGRFASTDTAPDWQNN